MVQHRAFSKVCHSIRTKSSSLHGKNLLRLHGFNRTHTQSSFLVAPCSTSPSENNNLEKPNPSHLEHHGNRLSLLSRSFVCSTHEVEEDFDAEPCKHVRNFSNYAGSDSNGQKMSARIEPPRAGILDKEDLRKRRTQPFSEKCWMQGLGVGLYRDKIRNRRGLSTAAMTSNIQEEQPSKTKVLKAKETLTQKQKLAMIDEKGLKSEPDESIDELGVIDTDSEEEDYCHKSTSGLSSMIREENLEALQGSLREMETSLAPGDPSIGTVCLRLAQLYDSLDEDPDKFLPYAERALKILGASAEPTFETAMCYHVVGSAYYKLDESQKAISHLEQAEQVLEKVVGSGANDKAISSIQYAVQILLGRSKLSLGKQEEALKHHQKGLAINERMLEPGNPDLAKTYQQAAEAYMEAEEYEEALNLCMKALPIYANFYGSESFEVAALRRYMALIYYELEDHDKTLSQHEIIRPILAKLGKTKEVAALDLASGEALISLERYGPAVLKLKDVVKETKESSRFHGHALVLISKAYAELKEGKNAAKYGKKAFNVLKTKKYSLEAASSLMELGSVYQQLNELDQAMIVLKMALGIFEQHPEQLGAIADIEGQLGMLYTFVGKVEEGLPHLEKASSMIEEIYGQDSEELLSVYNHIAIAYLELGRFEDALAKLEAARVISVKTHGPEADDTIPIYSNLVSAYSGLDRFNKAIENQKLVIDLLRKNGGSQYGITLEDSEKRLKELILQAKSSGSGKTS